MDVNVLICQFCGPITWFEAYTVVFHSFNALNFAIWKEIRSKFSWNFSFLLFKFSMHLVCQENLLFDFMKYYHRFVAWSIILVVLFIFHCKLHVILIQIFYVLHLPRVTTSHNTIPNDHLKNKCKYDYHYGYRL